MQNRRSFIKKTCALCLSFVGGGVLVSQLSSCTPMPVFKAVVVKNVLAVPFTAFTEGNNSVIVRNSSIPFDILLVKKSNGIYTALEMKCSHQDNPLTANKTGLFCSSHGSTFDLEGNVLKEPALKPIKKYKTEIESSFVHIIL